MESGERMIYQQVADLIVDGIISGAFLEDEAIPSTNQLARTYRINPATAAKGMAHLIDESILYKKRGLGMYVVPGARKMLLDDRKRNFLENTLVQFVEEAKRLSIPQSEIIARFVEIYDVHDE